MCYTEASITSEEYKMARAIFRTHKKVDFHSHFLSPTYYKYLKEYEDEEPDRFETPQWSLKKHIEQMDTLGIAFAFISVSSPNLAKAPRETECRMVRRINLEGHSYVKSYPDRLGLFASLPLPHVSDSIREAAYAHEKFRCDGFGLSTNYGGVYLGDERLDPLMKYMNSIGAVLAVHPTQAPAEPDRINLSIPIPAMEFMVETTRTFMNMETHGIFRRYPNIKWIFPHAGAFLPILSDRINGFAVMLNSKSKTHINVKDDMKHVYFDCAGFPLQKQLHALLKDVSINNLLYGSDAPYTPMVGCIALSGGLESVAGLSARDKAALFYGNAVKMFPKLKKILHIEKSPTGTHTVNYAANPPKLKEHAAELVKAIVSKIYGMIYR